MLEEHRKLLELHRLDLGSHIDILDVTVAFKMLNSLRDCFTIYNEYFKAGVDIIESFQENIATLDDKLREVHTCSHPSF